VHYYSARSQDRRMHVYLHRATSAAQRRTPCSICCTARSTATTRGQRGPRSFIIDNLIASARETGFVVMPTAPSRVFAGRPRRAGLVEHGRLRPRVQRRYQTYVETHYRALTDRPIDRDRGTVDAAAQRSTSRSATPEVRRTRVFSSGVHACATARWGRNTAAARRPSRRSATASRSVFSTGRDDFCSTRRRPSTTEEARLRSALRAVDRRPTWINWREYLNKFARAVP